MAFGISENPALRKLLGWNPLAAPKPRLPGMLQEDDLADEGEPALGPFSEAHAPAQDPETIHVDQQLASIARSPTITPAAGIGNRKGIMRASYAMAEGLGNAVETAAPYVGHALGSIAQGASDLFGGPDLGISIAHAADPTPGPVNHPQSEVPPGSPLGLQRDPRGEQHAAEERAHPTDTAAPSRHEPPPRTTVPSAEWHQPYTNEDLNIEHAAGPSRGGYGESRQSPKTGWMPASYFRDLARQHAAEDLMPQPPGRLPPSKEEELLFSERQGEIKFAAMERIIDQDHARIVNQIMSDPRAANPAWKATALDKAAKEAMQTKLENRRLGMSGWPRGRMGLEGEYLTEPMMPGPMPGRLGQ